MATDLLRCISCRREFTEAEAGQSTACPVCGSKVPPQLTKQDITLTLNWQDIRILANYASRYVDDHPELQKTFDRVCDLVRPQRPEKSAALTLREEIAEAQADNPTWDISLIDGRVLKIETHGRTTIH